MAKFYLKFILSFLLLFFLFSSSFAYALEAQYPEIFGLSINENSTLPEYAKYFFNVGMISAGILAVIVVAFGGTLYLISSLRGQFTSEGKEWIKAGILGMLLILSAYLIAYTINPYLVIFDLKGLAPLTFLANLFETPSPPLPVDVYFEIPIGTLTENVLARQIDCYDFDGKGDPIPGRQIGTDDGRTIFGPTYLENDRPDCALNLAEAFEKKFNLANELAKKISELMATCSCAGNCDTQWSPPCDSEPPCIGQATCTPVSNKNCCSDEIREKIEHGPIVLDLEDGLKITFRGLDEFRSNSGYPAIKNIAEMQPPPRINNKEITAMNIAADVCGTCDLNCPVCFPGDGACLLEKQACKIGEANCRLSQTGCLQQNSPWHNLKLIDQLAYFEGKIGELKQSVKFDLDNLEKGEGDLQKCYLADSYIDFIKKYERNDDNEKIIAVQTNFRELGASGSTSPINPAKYCEGFEYGNSTCYSQCQQQCPGATQVEFNCYKGAPDCNNIASFQEKQACLAEQARIIKQCYSNRTCLPELSPFKNFSECMIACKINCFDLCDQKSGQDKLQCQIACNDDSQCLLENEDKCVISFNRLKDCTDPSGCINSCQGDADCENSCRIKHNNPEFLKNCAETSAALCTYGSDQNAGYPDCLKYPYSISGNYSSSFIYENPISQICSNPNAITGIGTTCQSAYPETAKCPSASRCPECPCGITYKYTEQLSSSSGSSGGVVCPPGECLGNDGVCSPGNCASSSANLSSNECVCPTAEPGTPECYKSCESNRLSRTESEYRVVSANCAGFSYNDDPLTFYCNQTWWEQNTQKNQEPLGSSFTCEKEQEIPIGNSVDDSEKWARSFIESINKFTEEMYGAARYLIGVGQEQDYCECSSKCGPVEFACQPKCEEGIKEITDEEGNVISTEPTCIRQDCIGNSCQKMIHILLGGSTGACQGEGVATYLNKVRQGLENFKGAMTGSQRSDILKELEYSRKMVNACSQNYSKQTQILSCTRVEDEIIPPIIGDSIPGKAIINGKTAAPSYCYGQAAGEVLGAGSTADNWFCCQSK